MIAVGKDQGSAVAPGEPMLPDGPLYETPLTRIRLAEYAGGPRKLYIDEVLIGEIVAIIVDHKDEIPPDATCA